MNVTSYIQNKTLIIIFHKIHGMLHFSPPVFINQKMESRYYLNSTFQVQYFNVIFRQFILNIYFDHNLNNLGLYEKNFASNYQKVMILQELYIFFECMYIGDKKKIITDFF